jgi:hypothetical protein
MPISLTDGCGEAHWLEVKAILTEAIDKAGFKAELVSSGDESGIIQKRIIQNLYENPIVVCDVSGKNPNVMFELGLRLAFDKPTIVVKDDKTSYSFDTSPIEHLGYPRDLRYAQIVAFKESLAKKVRATHEKAATDPSYTTFLKNFGQFAVAKLDTTELPKGDSGTRNTFDLASIPSSELLGYYQTSGTESLRISRWWGSLRSTHPTRLATAPFRLPNITWCRTLMAAV